MNAKGSNMLFSSEVQEMVLRVDNFKEAHFFMSKKCCDCSSVKVKGLQKGKGCKTRSILQHRITASGDGKDLKGHLVHPPTNAELFPGE